MSERRKMVILFTVVWVFLLVMLYWSGSMIYKSGYTLWSLMFFAPSIGLIVAYNYDILRKTPCKRTDN